MIVERLVKKQLERLAEDHPTRQLKHCVNQGQVKYPCRACAEICPQGVYTGAMGEKTDFSVCINCNLCVSTCPARCLAPSALNAAAYLRTLQMPDKCIVISGSGDAGAHLQVASLAALPWEFLACLAWDHKVLLLTGPLQEAEKKLLGKTLARLILFFGQETYADRFTLAPSGTEIPAVQLDRRALFHRAGRELQSRLLPSQWGQEEIDGLLYRRLLADKMQSAQDDRVYGFPMPRVEASCTGCTVCQMLCPQKAIQIQQEPNGFSVVLDPLHCNGCGLCTKTCIHQAISGMATAQRHTMAPVRLFRTENE